jgi:hypothetical protein
MGKLSNIAGSEQLNLDDVLAEFRDKAPLEGMTANQIGLSVATTEVTKGDKIGTGTHDDGNCPHSQQCESERQQRPYYLPQVCHWRAWGDVGRCPKNDGGVT